MCPLFSLCHHMDNKEETRILELKDSCWAILSTSWGQNIFMCHFVREISVSQCPQRCRKWSSREVMLQAGTKGQDAEVSRLHTRWLSSPWSRSLTAVMFMVLVTLCASCTFIWCLFSLHLLNLPLNYFDLNGNVTSLP